jgi:formamidopyrimidine-DNA glycosylase
MPELPEVETIARQIREAYLGKCLRKVVARPVRIFQNIAPEAFARQLTGGCLKRVERYGKWLYWQVDGLYPVFHLGMSGIFLQRKEDSRHPEHIHLEFHFDDGSQLFFQDARKFGKIYLYHQPPQWQRLGLDPTKENFTLNKFKELLHLKGVRIKSLLMDQQVIAGIGNIYASEILFRAGISPFRPARQVSDQEAERLYHAIQTVLQEAIERFGTTYSAYRPVDGTTGSNQHFLKVYHREGEPCPVCGTPIRKAIIDNRSTFYCERCQR